MANRDQIKAVLEGAISEAERRRQTLPFSKDIEASIRSGAGLVDADAPRKSTRRVIAALLFVHVLVIGAIAWTLLAR